MINDTVEGAVVVNSIEPVRGMINQLVTNKYGRIKRDVFVLIFLSLLFLIDSSLFRFKL